MKMSKLAKQRQNSRNTNGKRFYTAVDMALIKHDQASLNSKEKRGELKRSGTQFITPCGCGFEGCFMHYSNS